MWGLGFLLLRYTQLMERDRAVRTMTERVFWGVVALLLLAILIGLLLDHH